MLEIWTANTSAYRLFDVLDQRPGDRDYLAGDYSIPDIDTMPWTRAYRFSGLILVHYTRLKAWQDRLWQRPAVARGMNVPQSGPTR